ncbi:hypothetical protein ScPMuIL_004198 [Solemya velum]
MLIHREEMRASGYTLTYFDGKGRAEMIRMALVLGGLEYKDVRVGFPEWPALKPTLPLGMMPVLEVDGKIMSQTLAILRYVGRECGLYGKNSWEQAEVDCHLDTLYDIFVTHGRFIQEQDLEKKKKAMIAHRDEAVPKIVGIMEKALTDNSNGKGFLVGSSLTIADIALYSILDYPQEVYGFTLDKFPKVAAHRKMIESMPKIASYFKTRPEDSLVSGFLLPQIEKCQ